MEAKTKSIIYRIIATIGVLFWGMFTGALLVAELWDKSSPAQVYISVGMVVSSVVALVYIWWPRKKKD